ncbi:hypothetical protein [Hymenobacter profundi]|uniref:ATP-binding protein n=1 Tax=Hymenobacter profundi TaxID=1982110 RepID=A0ABS6WUP4_9BACT|nr:hypothetical protein [Hymenobacter profundi]MBW3127296.1 hypothetical protein [Hymenobacter profundi]
MSYSIREITTQNAQAAFVSDVALDWYPNHPNNANLAASYSWTRQQIGEELPSLAALNRLREGFESDEIAKLGNRHLWEAIYGHGKSHLALALANFFGKPADSPEVQKVLAAIKHAEGDYEGLKNFKASRQPYLVLRLFGNKPYTLAQGVMRGLEKAFEENPATKGTELGLWFKPAEEGLAALANNPDQVAKANKFLKTLTPALTLQDLHEDLSTRRGQYREQLSQMVHHVTGFPPAFGDVLGPKQVVESVVDQFCGEGKPFAGLLVLFDEFGRYIDDYAREYDLLSKNQPLQNLLEGIASRQSRAAIVAFTQANPEGIARRVMGANAARLEEVNKELTRFPDPQRKALVSPLEAVLGDFLKQTETNWNALLDANPAAEAGLDAAIDMTKVLFPARYASWKSSQVQHQLGYECYPLHPLTTALLCTLGIRETVSARPSLGFVQESYRRFADYSALAPDGTLQFISATQLVAYFKESLAKKDEDWNRYLNAIRLADTDLPRLGKQDAANIKADVLAAIFIRETANLTIGAGITDFEGIIAALCGHPRADVGKALRELAADGRIEHDPAGKKYMFYNLGQDSMKAKRALAQETDQLLADPFDLAKALRKQLPTLDYAEEVSLGNAIDWAAPVHIVPCALWSRDYLRQLLRRYQLNAERTWLDTGVRRGYAIRPVGHTEEDVAWLRTNAPTDFEVVIQELDAAYPPPAVLVLPQEPHAGLLRALAQQQVLQDWGPQTRADFGDKAIEQIQTQIAEQRQVEISKLRDEEKKVADYRVPTVYAPMVNAEFATVPKPSLRALLKACYTPAYGWRAPYLDDAMSSTSYRKGVWTACDYLRRDKFIDWEDNTRGSGGAPARKVYEKILCDSTTTWAVVDKGLRVVDPRLDVVQRGWKVLEEAVPAGTRPDDRVSLREPLLKLLNAPYGYDYYALGLLFCAWAGRHRRTLSFYQGSTGQRLVGEQWFSTETNFEKVISTLLGHLDLHAAREDQNVVNERIELVIREWEEHKTLDFTEAVSRLAELKEYATNEASDPVLRERALDAAPQLTAAIQKINEYHIRLDQVLEELPALASANVDNVRATAKLLTEVRVGAPQVSVLPKDLDHAIQVEAKVISAIRSLTMSSYITYSSPAQTNSLNKCKENEGRLLQMKSCLSGLDTELGVSKLEEGLKIIQFEKTRIEGEELDAVLFSRLKEVDKLRNLAELRHAVAEFSTRKAHSEKGITNKKLTLDNAQARIQQLEQELTTAVIKAKTLPEHEGKSLKALTKEVAQLTANLQRQYDAYQQATPEAAQHEEALKWCGIWTKILDGLIELADDTVENTGELTKLLKKYDKLLLHSGITEIQQAFVGKARKTVEAAFAVQVQAAVDTLTALIARNDQKEPAEPAAQIVADLQVAAASTFHFLPKEEKARREKLEKALQKRLDADQVEDIAYRFSQIKDTAQRTKCIERLRQLLEKELPIEAS